ncbi:hypothetical protein BC936DRAFT_140224 [Jimgerdemannia flammicorona]|uniref:Uncharacterized protein n=2 Tax=Jimgerdemannia flammicorona TaxID=994334 RepID=A0A433AVR3_9FUNG|nr:hypothetical protein BC936DRAFT_140224 [Jimgerdemannia flammicorona]RUS18398.1 hypothetical protein BC938DRAFT_475992 [Jimgerdemannia flammicorona]
MVIESLQTIGGLDRTLALDSIINVRHLVLTFHNPAAGMAKAPRVEYPPRSVRRSLTLILRPSFACADPPLFHQDLMPNESTASPSQPYRTNPGSTSISLVPYSTFVVRR